MLLIRKELFKTSFYFFYLRHLEAVFLNYFLAISPMHMMKVFAYGLHISQCICLEQRVKVGFSHSVTKYMLGHISFSYMPMSF